MKTSLPCLLYSLISLFLLAEMATAQPFIPIKEYYQKYEFKVPMRDGVKLHTAVYVPKDASESNKYPFVMERTCYNVAPYGPESYATSLGPSGLGTREKYIFVEQDVRGRWMSEGTWTNVTPQIPNKTKPTDIDESTDTYDTIEWLLKNVPFNNGKVGQHGISYPGFYTAAGALSGHPALKASSPQAPVSDFFFEDFHHNGAFTQGYIMTFPVFGVQKTTNTSLPWYGGQMIKPSTQDGYQFNMEIGPLKNADKYYKDNFFWQEHKDHPNYDDFWKKRGLVQHFKNIKPAVMLVGGWYDAEDLYGPLNLFKANEKSGGWYNTLVMGPFGHGRWSRETGKTMHSSVYFGDSIATFYQKNIEAEFFRHFLKGPGDGKTGLPKAYLFDTGKKEWRKFDAWPAKSAQNLTFYLEENGKLSEAKPAKVAYSEYISDPLKPVPGSENLQEMINFTPFNYMSEDQRFAARRTDVLVFQTDVLTEDVTLGGEIMAKLKVSTTGTDADFVVKLVDVYPERIESDPILAENQRLVSGKGIAMSNYHQMVRSEIMRARFRNSFEKPEPFVPNKVTDVNFRLQDVLHTFKKGHRIQIQVQSSMFPIFDRNPQKYVPNIYLADEKDFQKATHKVFNMSAIEVQVLK
ncbi:MAG: CocE/NonD family hydrolase [Spirosomataceae bacterium]